MYNNGFVNLFEIFQQTEQGRGIPDMAQTGGTQPEKLDEALGKIIEMIKVLNAKIHV